ncbi:hypothetical protein, partial [Aeromonas hydrophila]|uniref:hypothetical protein n=1 Tax=Aeromonas hydrophila TaxID=644 RepID=UPI002B4672D9
MFEFKKAEIGVIEEDQPEHLHLPFEIRKVRFDEKTARQDIQLADGDDLWIGIDAEWVVIPPFLGAFKSRGHAAC